jgi:hypothetical protein
MLIYWVGAYILRHTIRKNTEAFLIASKEIGLEALVNAEKT